MTRATWLASAILFAVGPLACNTTLSDLPPDSGKAKDAATTDGTSVDSATSDGPTRDAPGPRPDGPGPVPDGPTPPPDAALLPDAPGPGPTTGELTCANYNMGSFSKSCLAPSDCVAASHQTDCCGNSRVIGINNSEQPDFTAKEAKCAATYPGCGCPAGAPKTDDGSLVGFGSANGIGVDCVSGTCMTYALACGQVCAGDASCQTCSSSDGVAQSICSKTCATNADCTHPKLPACRPGNFGSMFCQGADTCAP